MKTVQLVAGVICLLIAALVFILGAEVITFATGTTNVTIYTGIVLTIVGLLAVVTARKR
jgi:hypothetical protein